jgi:hypothetical protein
MNGRNLPLSNFAFFRPDHDPPGSPADPGTVSV